MEKINKTIFLQEKDAIYSMNQMKQVDADCMNTDMMFMPMLGNNLIMKTLTYCAIANAISELMNCFYFKFFLNYFIYKLTIYII